jgi:hypothetical protein
MSFWGKNDLGWLAKKSCTMFGLISLMTLWLELYHFVPLQWVLWDRHCLQ